MYNLVCEEGIEARIAQLVADKRAVFSGLFDGTTDEVRPDGASSFLARVEKLIEPANASAAQALPASPAPLPEEELAEDWAPPLTGPAADPVALGREPDAPVVAAPAAATPVALATLFGQVTIRPSGEGRVSIDAPKEVATQLAAMLAGMARMFEEAGR